MAQWRAVMNHHWLFGSCFPSSGWRSATTVNYYDPRCVIFSILPPRSKYSQQAWILLHLMWWTKFRTHTKHILLLLLLLQLTGQPYSSLLRSVHSGSRTPSAYCSKGAASKERVLWSWPLTAVKWSYTSIMTWTGTAQLSYTRRSQFCILIIVSLWIKLHDTQLHDLYTHQVFR